MGASVGVNLNVDVGSSNHDSISISICNVCYVSDTILIANSCGHQVC